MVFRRDGTVYISDIKRNCNQEEPMLRVNFQTYIYDVYLIILV